jgi:hypothetical protein
VLYANTHVGFHLRVMGVFLRNWQAGKLPAATVFVSGPMGIRPDLKLEQSGTAFTDGGSERQTANYFADDV